MTKLQKTLPLLSLLGLFALPIFAQNHVKPDVVLKGTISGKQNHSYVEAPFTVPEGIETVTVTFSYTGRDQKTTLDVGLLDPQRFRGWSGGNKSTFTVGVTNATPSYLPGPILPGQWKLLIGAPNIRSGVTAQYKADITFTHGTSSVDAFTTSSLRSGPAWFRGDLHMHTAHSDGSCLSQAGKKVPCPVFLTAQTATDRGLDFIAVTDHNTDSHYNVLRELQPYFDKLLFIPGREVTTFQGHANLFGPTGFFDFRVGTTVPKMQTLFEQAQAMHAILSINHPNSPTGEVCMGCGWTPEEAIDPHLIHTIEAVNGGSVYGPQSGVSFWEKYLNQGLRVTAIGGSDNHNAQILESQANAIGRPTTVVYANDLSVASILDGIRAGHVFIDLQGSHDRGMEVTASVGDNEAIMGDTLVAPVGSEIEISAHVMNCPHMNLRLLLDGKPVDGLDTSIRERDRVFSLSLPADGKQHWLRPDVVDSDGKLVLMGNPVYLNFQVKE